MNYTEAIRYIRRFKKNIRKGRHDSLSCHGYLDIREEFGYPEMEIAARFLRRAGYPIEIRIYYVPLGPLCFGKPLSVLRYVSIIY